MPVPNKCREMILQICITTCSMLPVVRCLNAQRLYFRACISQSIANQAPSVFIQSKMTKCSKAFANRYFENPALISNHSPCPRGTHQSSLLICCLNAQSVASQNGCSICSKTYNFAFSLTQTIQVRQSQRSEETAKEWSPFGV